MLSIIFMFVDHLTGWLDEARADLRAANVDLITLGQYLRPSDRELPVERYVPPAEFGELADEGRKLGFLDVYAGPFVRSSYNADSVYDRIA